MFYVCFNNDTEMKKVIYIAFVLVGLMAVSCSKENIQPNKATSEEIPVWKSSGSVSDDTSTGDGAITDPNSDRDENSRKRN